MYALFMMCERDHALKLAKTYARKAVMLDPACQHAYHAIGFVSLLEKDCAQVIKSAERIIELNSNAAYMVGAAGAWMAFAGEWEQGLHYIERSITLNPFYPKWLHAVYVLYHYKNGEYEHALDALRQYNFPHFWTPLFRAAFLGQLGRRDEARAAGEALLKLLPDFAERMEYYVGSYGLKDDLVESLMEGLNKAGIGGKNIVSYTTEGETG